MAPRDTQVCCCGASKWTSVIAGFQIGGAICIIIIAFFAIFNLNDSVEYGRAGAKPNDGTGPLAIGLLLLSGVINVTVGIILQIGNKQGSTCCLCTWVTLAVVAIVVDIGAVVYLIGAGKTPSDVLPYIGGGFFQIFAICVVCQRIKDVKMTLAASGDGELSVTTEPTV